MNKRLYFILLTLLILIPQTVTATTPSGNEVENRPEKQVEKRLENRQELNEKFEVRKNKLASRAAEIRSKIQERREEFKGRQEELASKAAETKERLKERRLAFREKLSEFKDDKKASLAAKVDANIDRLNNKHTERMTNALEKLNEVVGRLEDSVSSANTLGKDTASTAAALSTAKSKISSAQTKVSEQSGKDYAPEVTDETTLGAVVSAAFKAFMVDMKATQALVVDAKQAVRTAAEAAILLK